MSWSAAWLGRIRTSGALLAILGGAFAVVASRVAVVTFRDVCPAQAVTCLNTTAASWWDFNENPGWVQGEDSSILVWLAIVTLGLLVITWGVIAIRRSRSGPICAAAVRLAGSVAILCIWAEASLTRFVTYWVSSRPPEGYNRVTYGRGRSLELSATCVALVGIAVFVLADRLMKPKRDGAYQNTEPAMTSVSPR
jgi:hypothetical protein